MKRLLVYSHDTYGLGNIRRMLAICDYLLAAIPDLSILLLSGSPMVHSFRVPKRLDYITLPSLSRTDKESYRVRSIGTGINETVQLRSALIQAAVVNFKPDLFLVDKKPYGVKNELRAALACLQQLRPRARRLLLLRDILDSPEATMETWTKQRYYEAIQVWYDRVLVVGSPEVFDLVQEYRLPASVAAKVQFCGYIRRTADEKRREALRKALRVGDERLILVTAGGGEDGYRLLDTYLTGLAWLPPGHKTYSLIVCGPEMPQPQRAGAVAGRRPLPASAHMRFYRRHAELYACR